MAKTTTAPASSSKLTDEQVREEFKKIQARKAADKVRRDSPEGKAAAKVLRDKQKAKRDEVLTRAAALGLK